MLRKCNIGSSQRVVLSVIYLIRRYNEIDILETIEWSKKYVPR